VYCADKLICRANSGITHSSDGIYQIASLATFYDEALTVLLAGWDANSIGSFEGVDAAPSFRGRLIDNRPLDKSGNYKVTGFI
jgi:hypothetical protein